MMKATRLTVFHLVLLGMLPSLPGYAEWNRFRGPNGSGVAAEATPPVEFGTEKNHRWITDGITVGH